MKRRPTLLSQAVGLSCYRPFDYLVNPKGVALLPFPSDASVANADIPESLSLQLPVVRPRREGLDGEHLRPVVEAFGVSGAGPAVSDPDH